MHFTQKMIDDSAKKLKIDISKYNMDQVKAGIQVELEHGSKAGKLLDVTHDDLTKTLQIALAHLEEDPQYYVKLETIEKPQEMTPAPKFIDTLKMGTILKDKHGNFVKITSLREADTERNKGVRNIVSGIFVDPNDYSKKRLFDDQEFSIWDWAINEYSYVGESTPEIKPANLQIGRIDFIEMRIKEVIEKNEHKNLSEIFFGEYIEHLVAYPSLLTRFLEFNQTIPAKYRSYFHIFGPDFGDPKFFENQATNIWNLIPDSYKKISTIKQLSFQPDPQDANLKRIVEPFTGKEELRIMMQGVHFDDHGIIATNAHILLFIHRTAKKKGTYCMTKRCWEDIHEMTADKKIENIENVKFDKDSKWAHSKYPNYQAVIPDNHDFFKVNLNAVREFCHVLYKAKLLNQVTHQAIFQFGEQYFGFNIFLLLDCVETFMRLGYQEAEFAYSTPNRGVVISPIHKHADVRKLDTDFILIMPVMLNDIREAEKGFMAFDMETQCVKNVGFDDVCMDPETKSRHEILKAAKLIEDSKKMQAKELEEKTEQEEKQIRTELEIAQEEEHLAQSHLTTAHDALALAQAQELELLELEMNLAGKGKKKKAGSSKHPAPRFKKGEKIAIIDAPSSPNNIYKVIAHENYNEDYGWETRIKNVKDGKAVTMYENLLESLDKEKEVLHELVAPNVGANPSGKWLGVVRVNGWSKDHAYFDNPATVVDWLKKHNKKATNVKLGDPFRIVSVSKNDGDISPIGKEAEEFLKKK
jgi:hypothetical protein